MDAIAEIKARIRLLSEQQQDHSPLWPDSSEAEKLGDAFIEELLDSSYTDDEIVAGCAAGFKDHFTVFNAWSEAFIRFEMRGFYQRITDELYK